MPLVLVLNKIRSTHALPLHAVAMTDLYRSVLREMDTRSFLAPFLGCSSRSDGRSFDECRLISVTEGAASITLASSDTDIASLHVAGSHSAWAAGSCTARCGGTTAVCGVTAQVGEPPADVFTDAESGPASGPLMGDIGNRAPHRWLNSLNINVSNGLCHGA